MTTKTKKLSIGVSGASGRLGAATIRELRARAKGARLIGISRTPGKVQGADETHLGDYDSPETLAKAYAGLDRLLIIPSVELRPGVRGEQNVRAIDAAVAAGVGQVVLLSSAGTYDVAEPDLLASYYRAELRLVRTAPAWTVLRMTSFAEEFVREATLSLAHGAIAGLAENRVSYVSRGDVAASAAGLLVGEGHKGATYTLTGPASLSGAERAQAIATVSGQPLSFAIVAKDTYIANLRRMGLVDEIVTAILSIQGHFAAGAFDIVTGDVERLSGRPPRSLIDVLREGLRPHEVANAKA